MSFLTVKDVGVGQILQSPSQMSIQGGLYQIQRPSVPSIGHPAETYTPPTTPAPSPYPHPAPPIPPQVSEPRQTSISITIPGQQQATPSYVMIPGPVQQVQAPVAPAEEMIPVMVEDEKAAFPWWVMIPLALLAKG